MQKIVISGASSGLGLELARKLSKKYYIICFARNLNKLKKKFSSNKNVEFYFAKNILFVNSFFGYLMPSLESSLSNG